MLPSQIQIPDLETDDTPSVFTVTMGDNFITDNQSSAPTPDILLNDVPAIMPSTFMNKRKRKFGTDFPPHQPTQTYQQEMNVSADYSPPLDSPLASGNKNGQAFDDESYEVEMILDFKFDKNICIFSGTIRVFLF